jgi:uncharacterized protein (UPF0216 family)
VEVFGYFKGACCPDPSSPFAISTPTTATTIQSLEDIASEMTDEQLARRYVPFVLELAAKDWFTARISAVSLFAGVYKRVPESNQRNWRSFFLRLCMDESPIVRRRYVPRVVQT